MVKGGGGGLTTWICTQDFADCFSICADAFDSRDKVAAVALEEDAVFGPVVVFVVLVPNFFKKLVVLGFWV